MSSRSFALPRRPARALLTLLNLREIIRRLRRLANELVMLFFVSSTTVMLATQVSAQVATTQIAGTIVTQENGPGVGGATVLLYRGDTLTATTTSNADGQYTFPGVAPGEYSVAIRVTGYTPTRIDNLVALTGSTTTVRTP